jgi:hypothetical protein
MEVVSLTPRPLYPRVKSARCVGPGFGLDVSDKRDVLLLPRIEAQFRTGETSYFCHESKHSFGQERRLTSATNRSTVSDKRDVLLLPRIEARFRTGETSCFCHESKHSFGQERRLTSATNRSTVSDKRDVLLLPRIEAQFLCCPAHSVVTVLTELPLFRLFTRRTFHKFSGSFKVKLLIMHFSPFPCYPSPLRPDTDLGTILSNAVP